MNVIQVISENKKTKGRYITIKDGNNDIRKQVGYKAKVGYCEAIIQGPNGPRTHHMIKVK